MERLTYRALGKRLGLSPDAARMRAKRRLWRVEPGNDGRAVVLVEEAELAAEIARQGEQEAERSGERRAHVQANDITAVQALEGAVGALRDELAAARQDRDRLAAELLTAREAAARGEGETRALRDALADLATRLDRAEAALHEARKPWLRRVLERWRG